MEAPTNTTTSDNTMLVLLGHFGAFATSHPVIATLLALVGVIVVVLGLVAGFIRPEQMPTVRTRAGARIIHRYGLAVRGSWADWKALISGIEDGLPPPAQGVPSASLSTATPLPPSDPARVSAPWHEPLPPAPDDRPTPTEGKPS